MAEATYVWREELASALDVKASAYMGAQLDRKCVSATNAVNAFLRRKPLYPLLTTRYWDWPNSQEAGPSRLYFDDRTLISATTLTSNGAAIPSTAYNLEPNGDGPPYDYLELNRSQGYTYGGVSTTQRAISLLGVWGHSNDEEQPAALAAAVATTTATTVTVTTPAAGVGGLLRIDSERMIVTDKSWTAAVHTVTNAAGLTADTLGTTLTVSDTSTYLSDEVLMVDTERMLVREVVDSTTLTVTRAWDGSTLAVHANGAGVRRQLTYRVQRGALGTTAATHALSAAVYLWVRPPLAQELATAYALDFFLQTGSGYARTVGQGDNERPVTGGGIRELEARVRNSPLSRAGTRMRTV